MGVLRQRPRALDQLHRDRCAAQRDDLLQIIDADQRNIHIDALGVGDEVAGALVTCAGVEHRGRAIAAGGAHHRTDVLRGFGVV
ncbi:hypothetical protein D3C86_1612720 [compost metagenome]